MCGAAACLLVFWMLCSVRSGVPRDGGCHRRTTTAPVDPISKQACTNKQNAHTNALFLQPTVSHGNHTNLTAPRSSFPSSFLAWEQLGCPSYQLGRVLARDAGLPRDILLILLLPSFYTRRSTTTLVSLKLLRYTIHSSTRGE